VRGSGYGSFLVVPEKAFLSPIDQLSSGSKMEPELPTDPQALRQLVVELLLALQAKDRQIGQLSAQLETLKRRIFGRSSEKLSPDQMALDLGAWLAAHIATTAPEPPVSAPETTPRTNGGHGRRRLPEHLPRHRTEYHPAPAERVCRECSAELKKIGEDVSEQLEYVPASLFVLEHARIKYACPHCQGNVVIGSLPVQPIAKGLPGPGLLAHVLTSKYGDHLPLNRLEGIAAARARCCFSPAIRAISRPTPTAATTRCTRAKR
jgi:transposase